MSGKIDPQHQRDELVNRAKFGEISGDEADAEAIKLGLGSLSTTPTETTFRPEEIAQWTIVMAVAWIAYLDCDDIREWSESYREGCWHWIWRRWRLGFDGPEHGGWFLEQRSKPTLALLGIASAYDSAESNKTMSMSVSAAQEALWVALREGFFTASGLDLETGRREEIPALDWHELVPVEGKGEIDEVRRGLLGTGYRDVLVPSAAIRGLWRPLLKKSLTLPPTLLPDGDGHIPLYCAAQWIATEGGQRDFDPEDLEIWRPAFAALLAAVSSDLVRVSGVGKAGLREPIEGHLFADLLVDYPFNEPTIELFMGEEYYLRSYPYDDEEDWRGGFSDAITNRYGDRWHRLMIPKPDIAKRWPFETMQVRTGAPGRPSLSIHLIHDELERRGAEGALDTTIGKQAITLVSWLAVAHPTSPRPTAKTVENQIRDRYRELRNPK